MLPSLLVTVDAEGDDLWSRPRVATTENARFLPRFQDLCERYGVRPTYLVTHEMAACPVFRAFADAALRREQAEIGMHLHAWSSPPTVPLTADDAQMQPRATDYPVEVMRDKVIHPTRLLETTFERRMVSHRGGRWAFDETYARVLVECGYEVDSSITPHVSWRRRKGGPFDLNGPDYTGFPELPYFIDLDDVSRPGESALLEVPLTTVRIPLDGPHPARGVSPPHVVRWLRPSGHQGRPLSSVARRALAESRECLVLMVHSSELMPGGSPTFRHAQDVEALYADLETLLRDTAGSVVGRTLSEFHAARAARRTVGVSSTS